MPSSAFNHIPTVCHFISKFEAWSILDVGVGFGKWGYLFREMTDIGASFDDPPRYHRENWKARVDGIEGFPDYISDIQRRVYDNIYIGDMREVIKTLGTYDVIFIGDAIEHISKEDGIKFVREAMNHVKKALVMSTPAYEMIQEEKNGNPLETHRSLWTTADFKSIGKEFGGSRVVTVQSKIIVAVIVKPGVPLPKATSPLKSFVRARLVNLLGERRYKSLGGV